VGVYGFLRIALPLLPDAAARYQDLILGIAVVSILYGSVLAFSQDNLRLVVGYSSVAQLGFITLGIFAFDPKGAQGALLQMVSHGLVVAPLFFIIGIVALRAGGSESLRELGGAAFRAPVLAALFLIIALATLAMPGSPNFVGELLILFGVLETKLVFGVLASVGVALASVYMIRMFQRTMHYRVGPKVESSELRVGDFIAVAPLVAVVVALGVYPQFVLGRTGPDTVAKVRAPAQVTAAADARAEARSEAERP
jgi:NADH-quinone oxidoreductase subunit M